MDNRQENKTQKAVVFLNPALETYEGTVINRALNGRSGVTPKGIKGITFEIMDTDLSNLRDIYRPYKITRINPDPVATDYDAFTSIRDEIVKKIQYKDIQSPASIRETLDKCCKGQYEDVILRGTKESAKAFNKKATELGLPFRMEASPISSQTTSRVGQKALFIKDGTVGTTFLKGATHDAMNSMGAGALINGGIEIGKGIMNGDCASSIAGKASSKAMEGAVTGGVSYLAGEAAFWTVGVLIAPELAIPAAVVTSFITGCCTSDAVSGVFDEVGDTIEVLTNNIGDWARDFAEDASINLHMVNDVIFDNPISRGGRALAENTYEGLLSLWDSTFGSFFL